MNPDAEMRALHDLRRLPQLCLVERDDIANVERWKALLRNTFVELRAAQIEADLMVVSPAAAAFFNDTEVRDLLRIATTARTVHELSTQIDRNRTNVYRRFKRRLGRAPKDVLALFRLVWAARLREDGCTPAQIASFLGFRDTDHAGLRLGSKLGLKKEQINGFAYEELVQWVADCCTERGDRRCPPRLSPATSPARSA